jgi:hypothetical protein
VVLPVDGKCIANLASANNWRQRPTFLHQEDEDMPLFYSNSAHIDANEAFRKFDPVHTTRDNQTENKKIKKYTT